MLERGGQRQSARAPEACPLFSLPLLCSLIRLLPLPGGRRRRWEVRNGARGSEQEAGEEKGGGGLGCSDSEAYSELRALLNFLPHAQAGDDRGHALSALSLPPPANSRSPTSTAAAAKLQLQESRSQSQLASCNPDCAGDPARQWAMGHSAGWPQERVRPRSTQKSPEGSCQPARGHEGRRAGGVRRKEAAAPDAISPAPSVQAGTGTGAPQTCTVSPEMPHTVEPVLSLQLAIILALLLLRRSRPTAKSETRAQGAAGKTIDAGLGWQAGSRPSALRRGARG